jgi:Family of unknown function (DUF5719)/IPT/TIG domain
MLRPSKVSIAVLILVVLSLSLMLPSLASAQETVDGWTKIANNGIDNPSTAFMFPNVEFQGKVYFFVPQTGGPAAGVPVWAYDGTTFSHATANGFGDPNNVAINGGVVFGDFLYMSTENQNASGQLWRTKNGSTWEQIGQGIIGGPNDRGCQLLGVQDGMLIIAFQNGNNGAQVWGYDGTNFSRTNTDGFGMNIVSVSWGATFGGRIQTVGSVNNSSTFIPIQYMGGTNWVQSGPNNFGDANNQGVYLLATAEGAAWAGTMNLTGGQLWKFDAAGWSRVPTPGIDLSRANSFFPGALGDELELATSDMSQQGPPSGPGRVYRQNPDGSFYLWIDQFGDPNNAIVLATLFNGQYVAGTGNFNGFQVWSKATGPYIQSISPESGAYGEEIALTGSNFGDNPAPDDNVSFQGQPIFSGNVISWSDTEIRLRAPEWSETGGTEAVLMAKGQKAAAAADDNDVTVVTGAGASNSVDFSLELSNKYMFAEGTTRDNPVDGTYQEWLCICNPNIFSTKVRITYLLAGDTRRTRDITVEPQSRTTVNVVSDVGKNKDVSAMVDAEAPIVAERTMYFTYRGTWPGGTSVLGAPHPGEDWYFGEGTTRDNVTDGTFQEWLCLGNPNETDAAVTLDYTLEGGVKKSARVTVPAMSRVTRDVGLDVGKQHDVSVHVRSSLPVVAERPMYFNYKGKWTGGDDIVGLHYPAMHNVFAEGCTYPWYDEWLSIWNPGPTAATVTVQYKVSGGVNAQQTLSVPPSGRVTRSVNAAVGPNHDVSTVVDSDVPVVAERSSYFAYQNTWPGGTVVTGSQGERGTFLYAEGTTRDNPNDGSFDEWVTMVNPGDAASDVTMIFMRSDGVRVIKNATLAPNSRTTFSANQILGDNVDASLVVEASGEIAIERPMYFNYRDFITGGSDSTGYGL